MKYFAIFFLLLFVAGCSNTENKSEPAIVVSTYFEAWNQENYRVMYNLISDGFKSLEPTAATFDKFKNYAEAQAIDKVNIISILEMSNDGKQATVDYNVRFTIKDKEVPFKGVYALKYKEEDTTPGWRLIHPYGDNIDTS